MVVATDFLIGVLSAIVLFAVLRRFFDSKPEERSQSEEAASGDAAESRPVLSEK